ncbi:hypothetical protein TNCV_1641981 [Trichonephila clavipes]|nr:hypothetical protein TNCV_1641981 [Trichonephila clavipes]
MLLYLEKYRNLSPNLTSFPVAKFVTTALRRSRKMLHPQSLIPQNMAKILHRYTASWDPPTICFSRDPTNHSIG